MQHKWFALLAGLIVFSLLISPVGMAGAQGTPPPTPKAFQPFQPPSNPPFEMGGADGSRSSLFPTVSGVNAPATSVGVSGFSFSYSKTIGTTGEPYILDADHLNGPNGMFIDASDTLFVTEERGHRALAYNSSGVNTMVLGHAGQPWHHDDFLSTPVDITKDGAGNIWVAYGNAALKEFDLSGNLVQHYPAIDPWLQGDSNDRFNTPRGIAFNADGLMFVSDTNNHRIQIYNNSGGTPSYLATIGVTGVPQSDNTGFNQPAHIAFDSLGRLYVVDTANYRVQRCASSDSWATWACNIFLGETGVPGDDLTHIAWSFGIEIDSTDNIFVADGENFRVLKCDTSAVCQHFTGTTGEPGTDNAHFRWPADVEVDSTGTVFVSDLDNFRIQKFNSAGVYQSSLGVSGIPYLTDASHLNAPWGIARAADGSFYVTENRGHRLIKMDANGVQEWSVGEAGVYGDDNAHFGIFWGGLEGSPAVDANGRVYVGDTPNNRVQIFNSDGTYYDTLGEYGQGNYQFDCPTEIAVHPTNGDIYILDRCNQRVQVFTSALVYKGTIGTTASIGDDNLHFNWPWGLTVDASSNVFVADHDNHRVQKCTLLAAAPGFSCNTFLGETGVSGEDFNHFGGPISVETDSVGRVYVVDEWNNRVQVFDASGAYLATIGGSWDTTSSGFINPSGLALDANGNLYITDRDNLRIQVFTPGIPGWRQSNINGFGDRDNEGGGVSLQGFGDYLYAGLGNSNGGQVWRMADDYSWSQITITGFGNNNNTSVKLGILSNGFFYAGTWNQITGCEVYRTDDGLSWDQVTSGGFDNSNNTGVGTMAIFDSDLYVSTYNDLSGVEIWKSSNGTSWSKVNVDGFGDTNNVGAFAMAVFGNALYVGTQNSITGAELWRTDGVIWEQVNADGFGNANNQWPSLAVFDVYLYVGTANDSAGTQIWRSANGTTWDLVVGDGFGDSTNGGSDVLTVFDGFLVSATYNRMSGTQIRKTADGLLWTKMSPDGFGDSKNYSTYGAASFKNRLFLATANEINGVEVWQMLNQLYLPLVLR